MKGWVRDGWMGGWVDEWMWMDGWMDCGKNGWGMDGWINE